MSDDVIEATLSNFDYIETLSLCGGEVTLALDVVEKIIDYVIKELEMTNKKATLRFEVWLKF